MKEQWLPRVKGRMTEKFQDSTTILRDVIKSDMLCYAFVQTHRVHKAKGRPQGDLQVQVMALSTSGIPPPGAQGADGGVRHTGEFLCTHSWEPQANNS